MPGPARAPRDRAVRAAVFVDGVRTPFGAAGPKGMYARTRADDLAVRCIRELLRRNPTLPAQRIDEVALAVSAPGAEGGPSIGRAVALLAGLPPSVPGFALDRAGTGGLSALAAVAAGIGVGAYDIAIAGGVDHLGRRPGGAAGEPNPRLAAERILDGAALVPGLAAETAHDRFPGLTRARADALALAMQERFAKALADGVVTPDVVPVATRSADAGWSLAAADECPRPDVTPDHLAGLASPYRPGGRVTAGNSAGPADGAAVALVMAAGTAAELDLAPRLRLAAHAAVGVAPELACLAAGAATERALSRAGLALDDIGLIEVDDAVAVEVLAFADRFGLADDDARLNPYGGAIAVGHPPAASGIRALMSLAHGFAARPQVRFGLTASGGALGLGVAALWENPHHADYSAEEPA